MKNSITVWSVKYWETNGIQKLDGCRIEQEKYVTRNTGRFDYVFQKIGKDCFLTEQDALEAAEKKRLARIASLRKKIAKLEQLRFTK